MSKGTEILALISLLDDDDPEVYENVSNKILSFGLSIIPDLENAWGESFNPKLHQRIEELIHQINFRSVYADLEEWLNDDYATILEGALIVARYHFPDFDKDEFFINFNKVQQKIWLELNQSFTPLENINIFNQVFYTILGFSGNYNKQAEISDFCINHVLESRKGNSISIGLLYLILAQQLELPVYGVNLYRHFILAYQKNFIFDYDEENFKETIFYLNPMNKGVPFQRREIQDYLKSMQVEEKLSFFNPAPPKALIKELLFYMQYYFVSRNEHDKALEISQLKDLFN
ncbi:MAG: transglutaminase-like domain-containing protein [Chitinophagales bacterium]